MHIRYHVTREMRACESVKDAENKIVTLLHDKFLHLLAEFRYAMRIIINVQQLLVHVIII